MIRRALDWLANAKSVNDEVNADALRIADLEDANVSLNAELADARADIESQDGTIDFLRSLRERECETIQKLRGDLARAIQGNAAWAAKCKDLQDKLDKLTKLYAADFPLIEYANRQKANRARYDAKRRGK